ncbi:hypothetical protein J2T12_000781 [Paenibacillus anaericanus]|uniref:hypothetical protein n=1 Tax=Paenibacillus TaxID=44249 RepID=UPI002783DB98|nr:hypothetical protein [Paenibacillus anaericanus]MDQ0087387.1 hypothetical protein [Paenibacillus anaericanus]
MLPVNIDRASKGRVGLAMLICGLILLSLLSGCGATDRQKGVYDDVAEISSEGDTYSYGSQLGGVTQDGGLEKSFSRFNGMDTVWTFSVKEEGNVTIHYDQEVYKGKFKLVAVDPDQMVNVLSEGTAKGDNVLHVKKGTYRIKLVGNGAKAKINISIEADEGIEVDVTGK